MSALSSAKTWLTDSKVLPIPWNPTILKEISSLSPESLNFGVLRHDGSVKPHKPISDALDLVVEKLRKSGHEGDYIYL
jgi:amidase